MAVKKREPSCSGLVEPTLGKGTVGGPQYALFDLDNTLYPKSTGVMEVVSQRISAYMAMRLGMDQVTIQELRPRYWKQYGTTMRGLLVEYHIDPDDYLWYVHDFPMEGLLAPNVDLKQTLEGLPWHNVVFTNSSRHHTQQVLAVLGIAQHFQHIYDIKDTGYVGKPDPSAYHCVLKALGATAQDCLMIDDSVANLRPAKELGMLTVLVGGSDSADDADFLIHRVEDIRGIADQMAHDEVRRN